MGVERSPPLPGEPRDGTRQQEHKMRLLIVGALEGQLSEATKLAMDGGAKVSHAPSIEIALASIGTVT